MFCRFNGLLGLPLLIVGFGDIVVTCWSWKSLNWGIMGLGVDSGGNGEKSANVIVGRSGDVGVVTNGLWCRWGLRLVEILSTRLRPRVTGLSCLSERAGVVGLWIRILVELLAIEVEITKVKSRCLYRCCIGSISFHSIYFIVKMIHSI